MRRAPFGSQTVFYYSPARRTTVRGLPHSGGTVSDDVQSERSHLGEMSRRSDYGRGLYTGRRYNIDRGPSPPGIFPLIKTSDLQKEGHHQIELSLNHIENL